ncbi:hypothetical protein U6A24_12585 [Aquimarina gracilis]|uniref:KaiC-like domain-containing protein n=1 Tax=Aquimarina gracilis TaxID=874422 RepID=A0ABU5ZWS1_9FLAO|nr:hypothetical protein [Aquimarina gracilis]MEB3346306.1 hypothetical protein [Aquimarina gracilis]
MNTIERYNKLHNTEVSRNTLEELLLDAKREQEFKVANKLDALLRTYKESTFYVRITKRLKPVKRKVKRVKDKNEKAVAKPKENKPELEVRGLQMPRICLRRKSIPQKITTTVIEAPKPEPKRLNTETVVPKGLKAPVQKVVKQNINGLPTMADLDHYEKPLETFALPTELGLFLGELEKKPKHSVVVTLDAPAGSGKTRLFFQAMQDYANDGKRCLFFTLEEHSQSDLFKKKRNQYITPENYQNITVIDEIKDYEDFKKLVALHDVIFVDSFGKLKRLIKSFKLELDEHIRKMFDGKLFFLIFQRTTGKTMRGGSDSEFDGDVILQVEKPTEDYRDNFVIARKNRYNDKPMIKYSIFNQHTIQDHEEEIGGSTNHNLTPKPNLFVRSL